MVNGVKWFVCVCFRTALDVHGRLHVRLQEQENNTWTGYIEDPRLGDKDDIGALYYVIAVILIYGLSIVMMIASHIRKNKQDCQLRTYLKEMANLRKVDRREKLMERITALAAATKTKGGVRNDAELGPGKGLFRIGSKGSFRLGSNRSSVKGPHHHIGGGGVGVGVGVGVGGGVLRAPLAEEDPREALETKRAALGDDLSRLDDGNETADSEYLELPVDSALDMNLLTPSANATPLTSASATPSPPPRHKLKPLAKITFVDEGFVL